jgi:hypothetical protein
MRVPSTAVLVPTLALVALLRTASGQSIYGPGGLLLNPTADVPAAGRLTPAVLVIPQDSRMLGGRRTTTSVALDYGPAPRWEVGAIYLSVSGAGTAGKDPSYGGFAKYQILPGTERTPAVAVGGSVLTGGDINGQTAFLAVRQNLSRPGSSHPLRLHLGAFYANELVGVNRDKIVPFAGLEYAVTRTVSAFAEWRGELPRDVKSAVSVGVLLKPTENYRLVLAFANNGASQSPKFSFGVGFTIGTKR